MNYSNATFRPATQKQVAFLDRLLAEKDAPLALVRDLEAARESGLSSRDASRFIDGLIASPRKQVAKQARVEIEEGFYTKDGEIAKVQVAVHGSGNLYAKRLDAQTGEFGFERGLVSKIGRDGWRKLTLDEAKDLGRLYGRCLACGRTLTDETSIANGIGPICASKF